MTALHTHQHKPHILRIQTTAQTNIFEIQTVDLQFSNGQQRTYERLTPARRHAVMVLPIHHHELIMIREYAVGTERYELSCVKGAIDAHESPEQAANRELQEEIGQKARLLTPLRVLYTSPSHMFSPMHVFIAQDLSPARLQGDEPEPLQLVSIPLSELDDLINHHDLGDAKILAALMLLQRYLAVQAA